MSFDMDRQRFTQFAGYAAVVVAVVSIAFFASSSHVESETPLRIENKLELPILHLACTAAEKQRGLGYRSTLDADAGMLFPFEQERDISIWMKGMEFPLDIIWIGEDRTITHIEENVPLCGTSCVFNATGRYVLEVNAGTVAEHGVEVGDAVVIRRTCSAS